MSHTIEDLYRELSYVAGEIHRRHWAEGGAGNISINITSFVHQGELPAFHWGEPWIKKVPFRNLYGQHLLISISGSRMMEIAVRPADQFCHVKLDHDGNAYISGGSGSRGPTSELMTHLSLQDHFVAHAPENKVVLHTHADEVIALGHFPECASSESMFHILKDIHSEVVQFLPDGIGWVPEVARHDGETHPKTLEEFKNHRVVVWAGHGCISCGPSPMDAYDLIDYLAKAARIYLLCRNGLIR